jgi:hypothetical protein
MKAQPRAHLTWGNNLKMNDRVRAWPTDPWWIVVIPVT